MRTRLLTIIRLLSEWRQKCKRSPGRALIHHLIADIGNCTTHIKHECKLVESDFLDIGDHLQTIYQQALQLTRNAQSAVEHIGLDHKNNMLSEITRIARQAMADLEEEKCRIHESRVSIKTIGEQLVAIRSVIGGLEQVAKTLKIVAVNINIESSRLVESQEFFKVMPREIQSLSDSMLGVVQTLSDETEVIVANLNVAQKVIIRKSAHFHELVENTNMMVNSTTSDVTDLISRSIQAFQRVGDDAQVLSRSVGEIIQSIQIHDNISQRIEHVVEALSDGCQNMKNPHERIKSVVLMDTNLELQHSQLKSILSDIDNTYQQCTQSFGTIGRTVENIAVNIEDIVSVDIEDPNKGQGMDNSIGSMNGALGKVRGSIQQGVETISELKGIVQETAAVALRISGHMKHMLDVNFNVHLKSLNAIVGSIRLGDEGKSVGVLVEEMKDLAHRSNEIVGQVEKINTAITTNVSGLRDRIESSDCENAGTAEVDHAYLDTGIREFGAVGSAFIHDADNVARYSGRLAEQIHATTTKMLFFKSFADQIRGQLSLLNDFRNRLTPWIDQESRSAMLDEERLAARYTMQKERDIQAAVLAMTDPEGDSRAANIAPDRPEINLDAVICEQDISSNAECELGDNVELF